MVKHKIRQIEFKKIKWKFNYLYPPKLVKVGSDFRGNSLLEPGICSFLCLKLESLNLEFGANELGLVLLILRIFDSPKSQKSAHLVPCGRLESYQGCLHFDLCDFLTYSFSNFENVSHS